MVLWKTWPEFIRQPNGLRRLFVKYKERGFVVSKTFTKVKWEGPQGIFSVSPDLCKGCGLCIEKCPSQVIDWAMKTGVYGTFIVKAKRIERCTACRICALVCPDAAIDIEKKN